MDNMRIYKAGRSVPGGAVKKITGGAYGKAGLSDINPQWRIEKMTELFGPCGDGWIWEPVECWVDNGICYAHVTVQYLMEEGSYSKPIHGYGGTVMGRMDDSDLYKSTITDAVSNALRYLGIGADVWYKPGKTSDQNQFDTKYSAPPEKAPAEKAKPAVETITDEQVEEIQQLFSSERIEAMLKHYKLADIKKLAKTQAAMIISGRKKEIEKEKAQ